MNTDVSFARFINAGPVVVGGIGGSGTRVITQILTGLRYYMGGDLNESEDLLSYTLLFKRKRWFLDNRSDEKEIFKGLSVLKKLMITRKHLSIPELLFFLLAVKSMGLHGHNHLGHGKRSWAFDRGLALLKMKKPAAEEYLGWGWKEPNSHLLIDEMNSFFPDFKYIHAIRHGLDMAYSENQQQLFNWGSLFGIPTPTDEKKIPVASFRYWVEANRSVIDKGNKMGTNKFLLVNFDDLCSEPREGILKIIAFLGITLPDEALNNVLELPKKIDSIGRFRQFDLSQFSTDDLIFLRSVGFST
jgi:hypothetical protein